METKPLLIRSVRKASGLSVLTKNKQGRFLFL
nr:MAG TPA: hypothetical protein [Caudoviricetes sp.]